VLFIVTPAILILTFYELSRLTTQADDVRNYFRIIKHFKKAIIRMRLLTITRNAIVHRQKTDILFVPLMRNWRRSTNPLFIIVMQGVLRRLPEVLC